MRRCTRCDARKAGTEFAAHAHICHACHARDGILAVEQVKIRYGRALRISLRRDAGALRVLVATVDDGGAATGVVASFAAERLAAVQRALEKIARQASG